MTVLLIQRFKNFNIDTFLDGKIAEEQAKQNGQGQPSGTPKRSPSNVSRRGSGRTDSPSQRAGSRLRVPEGDGAAVSKAPDPDEFVIGDDASDISRTATPKPAKESSEVAAKEGGDALKKDDAPAEGKGKAKAGDSELPEDVVQKLARLENLTSKYKGMVHTTPLHRDWHLLFYSQNALSTELLRNYRAAHARVAQTEAFEATLREHTPLANVSDPGALVEFLNQRSLQSDMVMEELKRITGEHRDTVKERDELRTKLETAEQQAKTAFDEAAGLRKEREEQAASKAATDKAIKSSDPLGADAVNEPAKPPAPQPAVSTAKPKEEEGDTFFSYDGDLEAQVKKHEEDIKQQREYINELETENATMRQDLDRLDITKLDLEAMKNKISIRDREVQAAKDELAQAKAQVEELEKSRDVAQEEQESAVNHLVAAEASCVDMQEKLKGYQQSLNEKNKELEEKAAAAEENLRKYQEEHEKNLKSGKLGGEQQDKRMKTYQDVIEKLRETGKQTEEAKKAIESKVNDMQFEIKRLEAEASSASNIIASLRTNEAGLQSRAQHAETELKTAETARDEAVRLAEAKKGHESAVASLRSQLKRAEKDRDGAYQMILDCGKCKMPALEEDKAAPQTPTEAASTPQSRSRGGSETTERTESTLPTEVSTPSVEGGEPVGGDAKKKKKKKSKAKKKAASDESAVTETAPKTSVQDLVADPSKAQEILRDTDPSQIAQVLAPMMAAWNKAREDEGKLEDDRDGVIQHHEATIEERDQTIKNYTTIITARDEEIVRLNGVIKEKEEAIDRLDAKLKDQEGLTEEIETLRDDLTEQGIATTDAKHELSVLKEAKQKLQDEFDELQAGSDKQQKNVKDAEKSRDDLSTKCSALEKEISELKSSQTSADTASAAELNAIKEKLAAAEKEMETLQLAKDASEKQIEELKAQHTADGAELDTKHQSLMSDFEELKGRASTLDTDLAAANQLAQSRYKDLTDLREHLNKVQPELKKLREESAELKTVRADLEKTSSNVKRLESKERDLRSEIAEYKRQASDKDGELAKIKDQAKKSDERASALEDTYERARKDLEQHERTRDDAVEARDKLQQQLDKAQQELKASKSSLEDLEKQAKKLTDDASRAKDELQMKSAQHDSAQSLMDSMQDQSRELATQMKEVRERCESLDEELADAHRLLSERSREGDTMRRLLADVESRAESRVKEMRERMDLAVEERDRAEDESNTIGRKKAREIDELKNKLRDAERDASRATEAREDAEKRERDFKARQSDLEARASQAQEEVNEVRAAMAQLRDALDEGERQSRDLEKEKQELRNAVTEREARLERLQKSSKGMTEELAKLRHSSNRSSIDSSRVMSPVGRGSNGTPTPAAKEGTIDYVYLKNVLLQFLETPEKKHQMQLVPVLGMLLHMDK